MNWGEEVGDSREGGARWKIRREEEKGKLHACLDWALAHASNAIQDKGTAPSGSNGGSEGPHGSSSIPKEQLSTLNREAPTAPVDSHLEVFPVLFKLNSESLKGAYHEPDVIAVLMTRGRRDLL